jgi:hypothetical protein
VRNGEGVSDQGLGERVVVGSIIDVVTEVFYIYLFLS